MIEFGHRILSLHFKPLLTTDEVGIEYRGKRYEWHEVVKLVQYDKWYNILFKCPPGSPLASITLADGNSIKIYGRTLEKRNEKPIVGFLSNKSNAFDELLLLIQKNIR